MTTLSYSNQTFPRISRCSPSDTSNPIIEVLYSDIVKANKVKAENDKLKRDAIAYREYIDSINCLVDTLKSVISLQESRYELQNDKEKELNSKYIECSDMLSIYKTENKLLDKQNKKNLRKSKAKTILLVLTNIFTAGLLTLVIIQK